LLNSDKPSRRRCGIVLMDKAGWHTASDLVVPENLSLVFLPPYSPELNPIERLWLHLRGNRLSHCVFQTTGEIVDTCCDAWNWLLSQTDAFNPCFRTPGSHGSAINQVG
jgi:transposase